MTTMTLLAYFAVGAISHAPCMMETMHLTVFSVEPLLCSAGQSL